MPGPTSAHMLVSAMIKGGEKAVKDFSAISGDEWFGEAPEYVLTTYACGGLRNIENSSALFEVSVGEMRSAAGAIRRGRPAEHERLNGRIDFVIYWANQLPRAAIEVKSPIWSADKARLVPDFVELCRALLACSSSSLQFCGFVFYASVDEPERKHKNTKQRLRGLLDRVIRAVQR